jgi:hypothetical protein
VKVNDLGANVKKINDQSGLANKITKIEEILPSALQLIDQNHKSCLMNREEDIRNSEK